MTFRESIARVMARTLIGEYVLWNKVVVPTTNVCKHPLSDNEYIFNVPECHGLRFNKSGECLQKPAFNVSYFRYGAKGESMEDKRVIKISLEEAKEWYNEGGFKRELALKAFMERELTAPKLPMSWKEFAEMQEGRAVWRLGSTGTPFECKFGDCTPETNEKTYSDEKTARGMLALTKLLALRDAWIRIWCLHEDLPEWNPLSPCKFIHHICLVDYFSKGDWSPEVISSGTYHHVLSFPTKEMAELFKRNFRDLLNLAKGLY